MAHFGKPGTPKNLARNSRGVRAYRSQEPRKHGSCTYSSCVPGILFLLFLFTQSGSAVASLYDFLNFTAHGTVHAIDPDLTIRSIYPPASKETWMLSKSWGLPPLFLKTEVPGLFERADFFFPLGRWEESTFRSRLRFTPFFESHWSKLPPFDGYSRCLTLYQGRSDLGQDYWGVFPFYGFGHRKRGVDYFRFIGFPLYYESIDDDIHTYRFLWPIVTYADSPGRHSVKVWPLYGTDAIRDEYFNWFVLWPFVQKIDKHPNTQQWSSYAAMPFPLYVREEDCVSHTTHLLWPFVTYYHHYPTGHKRYSLRPLITYGSGGGVDELSVLFLYSSKKDRRKGTKTGSGSGYVSLGDGEVFTERKFLMVSSIQKRFRKGSLVFAKYKFWPFAEYTWDCNKGSHLKVPEIVSLKSDWWDINLGRLLRFVDFRDTPITRELSLLFGLSQETHVKTHPCIQRPPQHGDDNWSELIMGAFGKR